MPTTREELLYVYEDMKGVQTVKNANTSVDETYVLPFNIYEGSVEQPDAPVNNHPTYSGINKGSSITQNILTSHEEQ